MRTAPANPTVNGRVDQVKPAPDRKAALRAAVAAHAQERQDEPRPQCQPAPVADVAGPEPEAAADLAQAGSAEGETHDDQQGKVRCRDLRDGQRGGRPGVRRGQHDPARGDQIGAELDSRLRDRAFDRGVETEEEEERDDPDFERDGDDDQPRHGASADSRSHTAQRCRVSSTLRQSGVKIR